MPSFHDWAPDVTKVQSLCCADPDNLEMVQVVTEEDGKSVKQAIKQCKCGRRHHYMKADLAIVGATPSTMKASAN